MTTDSCTFTLWPVGDHYIFGGLRISFPGEDLVLHNLNSKIMVPPGSEGKCWFLHSSGGTGEREACESACLNWDGLIYGNDALCLVSSQVWSCKDWKTWEDLHLLYKIPCFQIGISHRNLLEIGLKTVWHSGTLVCAKPISHWAPASAE